MSNGKSFVGKRKTFIFNAFVDFKPMYKFENMGDVTEFGSLNHSPGKIKTEFSLLSGIFAAFIAQFFF